MTFLIVFFVLLALGLLSQPQFFLFGLLAAICAVVLMDIDGRRT